MNTTTRIVIGLVGESGSGKDTLADYLKHRYNATLLRFSDPIKDILHMFYDQISREDQSWLAVQLKNRFGKDILLRALSRKVGSYTGSTILSFNGIRYPEDYDFVREFKTNFVIYVTASQEMRWKRSVHRGEKTDDIQSLNSFREMEARLETEKFISELGDRADFRIDNEGKLEDLFAQADAVMDVVFERSRTNSL